MAASQFRRLRTEYKHGTAVEDSPSGVTFCLYSSAEIRSLSACNVVSPISFNQLGHPVPGGLYDLRMGPFTDRNELMCSTCLLHCEYCPGTIETTVIETLSAVAASSAVEMGVSPSFAGHLGHIELPLPVCNPLFYSTILQILKMSCVSCHQLRIPDYYKALFLAQRKLLKEGLIIAAQQVSRGKERDQTKSANASFQLSRRPRSAARRLRSRSWKGTKKRSQSPESQS